MQLLPAGLGQGIDPGYDGFEARVDALAQTVDRAVELQQSRSLRRLECCGAQHRTALASAGLSHRLPPFAQQAAVGLESPRGRCPSSPALLRINLLLTRSAASPDQRHCRSRVGCRRRFPVLKGHFGLRLASSQALLRRPSRHGHHLQKHSIIMSFCSFSLR